MRREQLVIERWLELERHQDLRYWQPPDGCPHRPHVGNYSRLDAIGLLENALTMRRARNIVPDAVDQALEDELLSFYHDVQGDAFDLLPLPMSCAPHIVQNIMPEMLFEYLKGWEAYSLVAPTGLRGSIVHDYICELTGLSHCQLVLGRASACLVIHDRAADNDRVYPFSIPEWLCSVNELIDSGFQRGLLTVRKLRSHLIREVQNSTCDIGNCLYRN